ncbi:MAG: hypothetical protein PUG64_02455 [Bacteroidales bacterium]|nr:hypothetical protein [Bacteroidales bacterium]MDY3913012.1 hypothetical protein [Sodaliphilus sp.]
MRKWILSIMAVAAMVIAADLAVGMAGDALMWRMPDSGTFESDLNQALNHKCADVLILGSSKAKHHYVPQVLADSLQMSVYNAGADGHDVAYASMVLQSWLTRCRPRVVVLDICNSMVNGDWVANSIGDVKCHYGANRAVTRHVDACGDWRLRLKLHSSLYRLNGCEVWLTKAYLKGRLPKPSDGYSPLHGSDMEPGVTTYGPFSPSPTEVEQLHAIARLCRQHGIALRMVLSPNHEIDNGMRRWLAAEARRSGVALTDFTERPDLWADRYYKDRGHMNHTGAVKFTSAMAPLLRADAAKAGRRLANVWQNE